jgi:hypothetical protein
MAAFEVTTEAYRYNLVCDVRLRYDKVNGDWPPQVMSITDIRER